MSDLASALLIARRNNLPLTIIRAIAADLISGTYRGNLANPHRS